MSERLYYNDSYLTEFTATVAGHGADQRVVYLDRTAFYPASGGQPHDTGSIGGARVLEVADEGGRVAHRLSEAVAVGSAVECRVDWNRRFDHMQQHSGQHLLSAVLADRFGLTTAGFHLGTDSSMIDVAGAPPDAAQLRLAEASVNEAVFKNLPLAVGYEHSSTVAGLRTAPEREGTLRVVSIEGLDRCACGGTHVRATGEIGPVLLRRLDKAHGNLRIEFLCGNRAVRRARADYDALSQVGRVFSCSIEEAADMAAAQALALQAAGKAAHKAAAELARYRGAELYQATAPDAAGLRRMVRRIAKGTIDEELRALAQSFTAHPKALFLGIVEDPPALLLAVSKDAGIHAGEALKAAVASHGGRGGGSQFVAQGGVPGADALRAVQAGLETLASS